MLSQHSYAAAAAAAGPHCGMKDFFKQGNLQASRPGIGEGGLDIVPQPSSKRLAGLKQTVPYSLLMLSESTTCCTASGLHVVAATCLLEQVAHTLLASRYQRACTLWSRKDPWHNA